MVSGYGLSVWLVPLSHNIYRRVYKMKHIPHITISTNHETLPDISHLNKYYDIFHFKGIQNIPRQYEVDPLYAVGFPCMINGLRTPHIPHMSVRYQNKGYPSFEDIKVEKPFKMMTEVRIADTTSLDPSEWFLI